MIRGSLYMLPVVLIALGYRVLRLGGTELAESDAYEKSSVNATFTKDAISPSVNEIDSVSEQEGTQNFDSYDK